MLSNKSKTGLARKCLSLFLSLCLVLSIFSGVFFSEGEVAKAESKTASTLAQGACLIDSTGGKWYKVGSSGSTFVRLCVSNTRWSTTDSNSTNGDAWKSALSTWWNNSCPADIKNNASNSRILSYDEANTMTQAERKIISDSVPSGASNAGFWWLSTPSSYNSSGAYYVDSGGGISNGYYVFYSFGLAPACTLNSSTPLVSTTGGWRVAVTHTFNANNGRISGNTTATSAIGAGESSVTPAVTATRTGYSFAGWSTSASATTGTTQITGPATATTYYAVWTDKKIETKAANNYIVHHTVGSVKPSDALHNKATDSSNPLCVTFRNPQTAVETGSFNDMQYVDFTYLKGSKAYEYGHSTQWNDGFFTEHPLTSVPSSWYSDDWVTSLTLPAEVTEVEANALKGHYELTTANLPGVTTIGNSAFEGTSLTSVTFSDDLNTIGNSAFKNTCITGVLNIPYGTTSIGESAFENCTGITQVNIPATVTSIGANAFKGCSGITRVLFLGRSAKPGTDEMASTAFVSLNPTFICINGQGGVIKDEVGVTTNISDLTATWNAHFFKGFYANASGTGSPITNVSSINSSCTINAVWELATVEETGTNEYTIHYVVDNIPAGRFSALMNTSTNPVNLTFKNPETSIAVGALNPDNQKAEFTCFKGSKADAYGSQSSTQGTWCTVHRLTSVTKDFIGSELVERLVLPADVTKIEASALEGHDELSYISIPGVTEIEAKAFKNTGITGTLTFGQGITSIGEEAFDGCSGITGTVVIPATVTHIGANAFRGTGITGVVYLNSDDGQRPSCVDAEAFNGIAGLTVTTGIRYGFDEGETVLDIAAITSDPALASAKVIIVGPNVTEIGDEAFKDNTNLTGIILKEATGLTKIGDSAFENSGILSIDLSKTALAEVGDSAFAGTHITSVTFPETCETMGTGVFTDCADLTTADLGGVTTLPNETFKGCTSLTSVAKTDTYTSIGDSAFENSGIKSIETGDGLTDIGTDAFKNSDIENLTITNPDVSISGTGLPDNTNVTADTGSQAAEDMHNDGKDSHLNDNTLRTVYTITLDDNGGSGGDGSVRVYKGQRLNTVTIPTLANKRFTGYYTTRDGSVRYYDEKGDGLVNYTGTPSKVYAHWTDQTVTIKFNANGGSGTMANNEVALSDSIALPTDCGFSAPAHKHFVGWMMAPSGATVTSINGTGLSDGDVVNVYAKWETDIITIHFDANGGSGSVSDITTEVSSSITLPSGVGRIAFSGKHFVAWGNNQAGTIQYTTFDATTYTPALTNGSTVTLYAIWANDAVPTTAPTSAPSTPTQAPAQTQRPTPTNAPIQTQAPSNPTQSQSPSGPSGPSTPTTSQTPQVTPTASPAPTPTIDPSSEIAIVKYNLNGGTAAQIQDAMAQATTKDPATDMKAAYLAVTSVVPTKTGMQFLGWSKTATSTVADYKAGTSYFFPIGTTTLYAIYADAADVVYNFTIKTMKAALDASGRPDYDVKTKTASSKEGVSKTLEADVYTESLINGVTVRTVTKTGDFSIDDGYELNKVDSKLGPITITADMKGKDAGFVVVLDRVKKDLVYDKNVDNTTETITGMPEKVTDYWGKEVTLSTQAPSRTGYTFTGWGLSKTSTTTVTKATIEKTGTTVYAIWTAAAVVDSTPIAVPAGTSYKVADDLSYVDVTYPNLLKDHVVMKDIGVTLEKGKTTTITWKSDAYKGTTYTMDIKIDSASGDKSAEISGITYETKGNGVAITEAEDKTTVVIPATVKIGSKTYKVTKIAKNAFKGSALKKITIGKNVKTVEAGAFADSDLTTLIIKSKSIKFGKGAFKGTNIKTYKLPGSKKQKKAMAKKIVAAGGKKTKYIKTLLGKKKK